MLLIVIPVLWLAAAAFVVILCRGAASADAALTAGAESLSHPRERVTAGPGSCGRRAQRAIKRPLSRSSARSAHVAR